LHFQHTIAAVAASYHCCSACAQHCHYRCLQALQIASQLRRYRCLVLRAQALLLLCLQTLALLPAAVAAAAAAAAVAVAVLLALD
jgi:hypothetical protein